LKSALFLFALFSRIIHSGSSRKEKPFLQLGYSKIPADLFEGNLFGHEKSAFTGAVGLINQGKLPFSIPNTAIG